GRAGGQRHRRGVRLAVGVGPADADLVARVVARQHLLDVGAGVDRLAGGRGDHVALGQPSGRGRGAALNAGDGNAGGAGRCEGTGAVLAGRGDLQAEEGRRANVDGRGGVAALDLVGDGQRRVDRDRERLGGGLLAGVRRPVVTGPAERV